MPLAALSTVLLSVISLLTPLALGALALYVNRRVDNLATREQFEEVLQRTERTTQVVEAIKSDVAQRERQRELELKYRALQRPVLDEAIRLLVRLAELEKGHFLQHYKEPWSPQSLSKTNLERNKRDTTVFRFLRFLGALYLYRSRTAGLPQHACDRQFAYYIDGKIVPALASSTFPGGTVLWRETIIELSELVVRYSNEWKDMRPLTWFEFVALVNDAGDAGHFLSVNAGRIADFLAARGSRAWILGIYLADLIQDTEPTNSWENVRSALLARVVSSASSRFYLYGRTSDGRTDVEVAELKGKVPRNPLSPWYDLAANPIGYDVRGPAGVPDAAVEIA